MHDISTTNETPSLAWQMPATYDEVMLSWAAAELTSPDYQATLSGDMYDGLRGKIRGGGVEALSNYERSWLIGAFAHFRSPIILAYGPFRSWSFRREAVSKDELSRFAIIHDFPYPSFSLGELSEKIRDQPSEGEIPMCNSVLAIIEQSLDKTLSGLSIALAQQAPKPPILIEGYKRSLAALWKDDSDTIEIYLCDPCPAFVSSAIAENE
jgi:hypothetical protein